MGSSFLILHMAIILVMIIFLESQTSATSSSHSSSPKSLLVLPLKTQTLPSSSSSSRKIPFKHNVTLTVSLTVGSPPQNVTMVLDTGSELSWLHCNRNQTTHSTFNPKLSSSYTPTPCSSSLCKTRTRDFPIPVSCDSNKLCHATLSYADASSLDGNLAADIFYLGGSPQPGVVFGCMDSSSFSSNADEDSMTTGLMGMNRGSLSFVTQMGLGKFSYCISGDSSPGVLLFGDARLSWLGPLMYTPLVKITTPLPYFDRVAYTVQLEGIRVGSKELQLPKSVFVPDHSGAGQTIVDSGTQFTFLLGSVYSALKEEFIAQTKGVLTVLNDPGFVFQVVMDLCYRVKAGGVGFWGAVPAVTLVFEGAEMRVSGERLLYRVGEVAGGDWVYCFTFGNSDMLGIEAYVIGHHHQQNVWMEFDLVNSRLGFADINCRLANSKSKLLSLHNTLLAGITMSFLSPCAMYNFLVASPSMRWMPCQSGGFFRWPGLDGFIRLLLLALL
ncbi:Glutathione gamma-glutamylcysteinyltransferase 1 [Stylosanthes scabra]|uniref:Glutathione gamma-glutamylcysteinyltransferase 1 n=1 Tax=Stylosanthes scabra TaxID=79078 RepID=A0ABU6UD68_9FABA|nr:Glutathione gamma-glutamylcysteinyltransferase 1 [Stylosanthes scabra]